jgi:hypothetical protein
MKDSSPVHNRLGQMYGLITNGNQSENTFENMGKKIRQKPVHRITSMVFNYCGE